MQTIPVDAARLGMVMCVVPAVPRSTPDGAQRKDKDGLPQWVVSLAVRQPKARRAEVIEVVLTGEPPDLQEGVRVQVEDLEAVQWSMGDRSGMSWRAVAVRPAPAAAAAGGRGKTGGQG